MQCVEFYGLILTEPKGTRLAQPEEARWIQLPVGSQSAGGTIRGQCVIDWVLIVARDLGAPVPGHLIWHMGHGMSLIKGGKSMS